MANSHWIKLYIEVLDDAKMGTMPDGLWRSTIELFLAAGEAYEDGRLPKLERLAWRLRWSMEKANQVMAELSQKGIVSQDESGDWFVTHFANRQAEVSNVDRQRAFRKRKAEEEEKRKAAKEAKRNESLRNSNAERNEIVTPDVTHTDTDTDTDTESLSVGVREFLNLAGLEKFPKGTESQLAALRDLIKANGKEKTIGCATWLWSKPDMTLNRAIRSMQTAVPGWTAESAGEKGPRQARAAPAKDGRFGARPKTAQEQLRALMGD